MSWPPAAAAEWGWTVSPWTHLHGLAAEPGHRSAVHLGSQAASRAACSMATKPPRCEATTTTVVVKEMALHSVCHVCTCDSYDRHNHPVLKVHVHYALTSLAVLSNLWGPDVRICLELMGFYLLENLPPPDTLRIFHWVFFGKAASSASRHQ